MKPAKNTSVYGYLNFAQGGALPDVLYVIKHYGAVPQEVYSGLNYGTEINRHGEMEASLKEILDAVIDNKNGKLSPSWRRIQRRIGRLPWRRSGTVRIQWKDLHPTLICG